MLNQSGVTRVSGITQSGILIDLGNTFSVSCIVSDSGVQADDNGRKIVKAGTPLAGSLKERETAFSVASGSNATCVILHDVDVTSGEANAQAVVFGFIDVNKLDASVVEKITEEVEKALNMIKFIA